MRPQLSVASRQALVAGANALVAALVFGLDLLAPLGINIPLLYIVSVVLSLWQGRSRHTLLAASGCTVLTFARVFWAPQGNWLLGVANRALTVLGLWLTAFLVIRFTRATAAAARLGAIVESSDDAIIGEALDGTIAAWNAGAERVFGYTAAEAVGCPVTMLVPDDRLDEFYRIRARLRLGERVDHFDTQRLRKDGHAITVSLSMSPVRDAAGRILGASAIARDVSERIRAEHAARLHDARVRSILETAVDGILVTDDHAVIRLVNPAIERIFGRAAGDVLGRHLSLLLPGHERVGNGEGWRPNGDAQARGIRREVVGVRADGSTFPLAISVSEMAIDGERAFTAVMRDLTEEKRVEALLREQADLARLGQMAAVVAHEVRNALAGIRGALQVIGARLPDASPDQRIKAEMIKRVGSLEQFVADLLTLSQPMRPVFVPCRVAPVLARVVESLKNDPQFDRISIEIDGDDAILELDERLVESALLNLLLNAAQAMNGIGTIHIGIDVQGAVCRVAIRDTGPGIPPDVKERMFEPFFTTKHRGTGLGLAIARRSIHQHGGTITAQSTPGAGTTMIVTLRRPLVSEPQSFEDSQARAERGRLATS
jgi:two-component system sensor kinase FixL